jgi:hypothetical protein
MGNRLRKGDKPMQSSDSKIEEISANKNSLEKRLEAHPELRARFERLLGVVENAAGDVEKAAEAERRVIVELQQMGSEVLHAWARSQEEKKVEEYSGKPGINRKGKKTSIGTRSSGRSR